MHGTIEHALRQLSIGAHYKDFHFATLAVVIILNDETCLTKVNRAIYKDIAALTGFSPTAIERDLRTVIARAWNCCPKKLTQMAGYTLSAAPTVSKFLDIVSNYVRRQLRGDDIRPR